MPDEIGSLRERLTIQQNRWPVVEMFSLTQVAGVATARTLTPHGYTTGDYATVQGAAPVAYNGKVKVTVVDATTLTYPVSGSLASPADGAMGVTYTSDAQTGRKANWVDLATVWAEMIPLSGTERLQAAAIQAVNVFNFRIRVRRDVSPTMRVRWTPRWPGRTGAIPLEINSVTPWQDGVKYLLLTCSGVSA